MKPRQALHAALNHLSTTPSPTGRRDRGEAFVVGLLVESRGVEIVVSHRGGRRPWHAYTMIEQPLETEKLIEASGRTIGEALGACADAVEVEDG